MTKIKKTWLIDVDGVINVNNPRAYWPDKAVGHATADGFRYKIIYSPTLIKRIRRLIESDTVDVVWCTTWCAWADELERLFGFPTLKRAFTKPYMGAQASAAKLRAALDVLLDQELPLIWTDDREVPTETSRLYRNLMNTGRALLIRPDDWYGLTPQDMDEIERFCER